MASLDKIIGALLVGTYGNSILYTLEILAVMRYYSTSKHNHDTLPVQAMIYFTFLLDTVCTISTYACVYLYTITHWGDPNYLQKQYWPFTVLIITTSISAAIVQSFLIYRYWKLSTNAYVTPLLILLMLSAVGGSLGTTASVLINMAYTQRAKMTLFVTIWFSTGAAADIAIALGLLWQLSQIKSSFKSTQSLIHKLMASTIRTGTVTSVVAVIILISFLIDKQSNVAPGFAFCLGRVYALTMLYNLNNRHSLKSNESGDTTMAINGLHLHNTTTTARYEFATTHTKDRDQLDISDRSRADPDLFSEQGKVLALEP